MAAPSAGTRSNATTTVPEGMRSDPYPFSRRLRTVALEFRMPNGVWSVTRSALRRREGK